MGKSPVWQHTHTRSSGLPPPPPLPFLSTFVSRAFDNYTARGRLHIKTDFPKHDALKKYRKEEEVTSRGPLARFQLTADPSSLGTIYVCGSVNN